MLRASGAMDALAALCALCAPAFSACTPDTGIEVTTVKRTSDVSIKRSTINRADLEMSADNWKPVSAAEQTILPRNPFRGYTDTIMAENLRRLRARAGLARLARCFRSIPPGESDKRRENQPHPRRYIRSVL